MSDWTRRAARIQEVLATEPLDELRRARANELLNAFNNFALCEWLDIVGDLGGASWLEEATNKEIVAAMHSLTERQLAITEFLYNYIEGQDVDPELLSELTQPIDDEEAKLDDARFWAEAGNWTKTCEALGVNKKTAMAMFPELAAKERELEKELARLSRAAQELCKQQKQTTPTIEKPESQAMQKLPDKYAKDKRRWDPQRTQDKDRDPGQFWGV